jgi:hypothetical protein
MDVILIINHAFPGSFGQVDKAEKAIADRGRGPLNYKLLQHPDVLITKPASLLTNEDESLMPCLPLVAG